MHSVTVVTIRPWNCPGQEIFENTYISAISRDCEMSDLLMSAKEADERSALGTSVQIITDAALFLAESLFV